MSTEQKELNLEEAAAYLGIAPNTLYRKPPKKGGPRRGKRWGKLVYLVADLDAWKASQTKWQDSRIA